MVDELSTMLRTARVRSSLSQEELATALGTTTRTVSSWERGHSRPSLRRIPELAAALELDPRVVSELTLEVAKTGDHNEGTHR